MTVRKGLMWAGWGVLGLVVLVAAAGAAIYLYLRTSLPQIDGTKVLPGLSAQATVERDRFGIPTIRAQNEHDADFALGFVHAQDRLFEMEMLRRYGEGRIAEWAGGSEISRDKLMRTLGIEQAAESDFAGLSPAVQDALRAYADGVNAYIEQRSGAKPLFYYFVPGPLKWRAIDTLVIAKVLAVYLAQNFRDELLHAALAAKLSPEALAELFPKYPKQGLITLAALAPVFRGMQLDRLAALLPRSISQPEASNNWVVDGSRTVSGKPILANDPHLLYSAPPIWYLARLITPQYDIAGGTIPGAPLFIVGHNSHIGWGFTETGGDVEDTFVEKLDPDHPGQYLTPDGWQPFMTREETIHVKGGKDVRITVRSTRHGPVISDVMAEAKSAIPQGSYVLALEATFLQPQDKTMQAIWEMNRAGSWTAFNEATRNYVAPQMNMVVADTSGTIAFTAPARIPIRKNGDGWTPHPGWTGEYDWAGFVPFDRLPRAADPPLGRFISANNEIVPPGYPYFITRDWAAPYRANRIAERLDGEAKNSLFEDAAIQADTISLAARQLLPLMLQVQPTDLQSVAAVQLLKGWNGDMRADLAAPLIFMAWLREFNRELFEPALGKLFEQYWRPRAVVLDHLLTAENQWCQQSPADAARSCATLLASSLQTAVQELAKTEGSSITGWRWGQLHRARFWSVISRAPVIGSWFSTSVPVGGGEYTIDAEYVQFADQQHPYQADIGPGLRMILDFSDLSNSRFLIAPGMSENPFSPHYGDLTRRWKNFDYMTPAHEAARHTLTLVR